MVNKLIDLCMQTLELEGIPEQVNRIKEHVRLFRPIPLMIFSEGERLVIQTFRNFYDISVVNPESGLAVVQAKQGDYFARPTKTQVKGATLGPEAEGGDYVVLSRCIVMRMGMVFPFPFRAEEDRNFGTSMVTGITAYAKQDIEIDIVARRDNYLRGN